jgi:protein Mpv17
MLLYMRHQYDQMARKRPLLTGSITSAVLWIIGDAIAQRIEGKSQYDYHRTIRLACWGAFGFAPVAHFWYANLQRMLPLNSSRHVIAKVLLDQTIFAGGITSMLFAYTTLAEGKSAADAKEKINEKLFPTLKVNWMVWPAVQVLNLSIVPPHLRLFVVNAVALPWSAYLAYVSSSSETHSSEMDK